MHSDTYRNETGNDRQPGTLTLADGTTVSVGNVYAESFHILRGDDGCYYYMIEIEGTTMSNAQGEDDVFAFYGAVPPADTVLTSVYEGNIYGGLHYGALDGGELFAPIAVVADMITVDQDAAGATLDLNVLANDSAGTADGLVVTTVEGDAMLVGVWVDLPDGGRVLIAENGDVDFDANGAFDYLGAGQSVDVTLSLTVSDGDEQEQSSDVTITVMGINDGPVAQADTAATADAAGPITFNVLDNDSDIDTGDILNVSSVDTSGLQGQIDIADDGTVTYDTNGAFDSLNVTQSATDTFTYTVSDGNGGTATETVVITIEGSNGLPVAGAVLVNPTSEILESDRAIIEGATILSAVSDDEDDTEDMLLVGTDGTSAMGVNLDMNSDRDVIYHAADEFDYLAQGETITDSFTYTASDSNGELTQNTASVVVTGENDAPTVGAGLVSSFNADQGVQTIDLLEGASDVDNGAVLIVANVSGLGDGMTLVGNTIVVDTDAAAFDGVGTTSIDVTFDVVDEYGASVAQTLDVNVNNGFILTPWPGGGIITIPGGGWTGGGVIIFPGGGIITIPLDPVTAAVGDTGATEEDNAVTFTTSELLANDIDAGDLDMDGTVDGLTLTGVADGSGGTVALDGETITFTPDADFNGDATFSYDIVDSEGATSTATVTVNVARVNDAPVVSIVPTPQTATAGEAILLAADVADVDEGEDPTAIVTATVTSGGNDIFVSSAFSDLAVAGNGTDTVSVTGSTSDVNAALLTGMNVVTDVNASGASISVSYDDGGNGGAGALTGADAVDISLTAPDQIGTVLANDITGNGVLFGAQGNDVLTSAGNATMLNGGADHDILIGSGGQMFADGDGFDTFVVSNSNGANGDAYNTIYGFEAGDDSFDFIDLSAFDLAGDNNTNEEIFADLLSNGTISEATADDAVASGVVIEIADNDSGTTTFVSIADVGIDSLTADDFIFV